MSNSKEHMKEVLKNAEDIKIVGIIKPNEEAVSGGGSAGMVGYTKELKEHLINKINESEIVKEQLSNKEINVFTGEKFSVNTTVDINNLSDDQKKYLATLTQEEQLAYLQSLNQGTTSSYEENLTKLDKFF